MNIQHCLSVLYAALFAMQNALYGIVISFDPPTVTYNKHAYTPNIHSGGIQLSFNYGFEGVITGLCIKVK